MLDKPTKIDPLLSVSSYNRSGRSRRDTVGVIQRQTELEYTEMGVFSFLFPTLIQSLVKQITIRKKKKGTI